MAHSVGLYMYVGLISYECSLQAMIVAYSVVIFLCKITVSVYSPQYVMLSLL